MPAALSGERADRVIALVFDVTRSDVARLIDAGEVIVNGAALHPRSRRLREGDIVELALDRLEASAPLVAPHIIDLAVVFEDDDIIIIDKPAGLVVHPGAGHESDTLVDSLTARYPDLASRPGLGDASRPGVVHRLDKDTSGLLVVARSAVAFTSLSAQLSARSLGRTYQALALGDLSSDEGRIEAAIGRSARDRTRMAVRSDGREAITNYTVLERFAAPSRATLLEVRLDTGRTHQIRVHLAAIGHPIAGDGRYGGGAAKIGLRRPFLHACELRLIHPVTGETMVFSSELPGELEAVLEQARTMSRR